jgi:hypothetical protein
MPRKYRSPDGRIEAIVEPQFRGDLLELARSHPVWIADTPQNKDAIDEAWRTGKDMDLFEVSRCGVENPSDQMENLDMILGVLDDHHSSYDIIVHGLQPDASVEQFISDAGFRIIERTSDGFVAVRIPGVRERMIGR